jgi:hypothetical protein
MYVRIEFKRIIKLSGVLLLLGKKILFDTKIDSV